MKNKTICIPDSIFEDLKGVDNASGLITDLLFDYFNNINKKEDIIKPTNMIDIMEESVKEITKEKQTESLREKILEEIKKQEEEEKIDEILNEPNYGRDFYANR